MFCTNGEKQTMLRNSFLIAGLLLTSTLAMPAQAANWGGIDNIQAQQNARIQAGLASGALTASEAAQLRAKAAQIATMEARLRMNGLSWQERSRLQTQLASLNAAITRELNDRNNRFNNRFGRHNQFGYNNGYNGQLGYNHGRFGYNGQLGYNGNRFGNNFGFGNVDNSQQRIENQLNRGLQNGSLTQKEYNRLDKRFDKIAEKEAQMRASGGGLSFSERAKLNQQLGNLNRQVTKNRFDRQHNR
jgi:opacity protein-like surface antigen